MIIYTDGSKKGEGKSTGSAVVIEGEEERYIWSIDNDCTIFTAEVIALWQALRIVKQRRETRDVIIWTDSESSIKALENNNINAYENIYVLQIKKMYHELTKVKKIVFAWVPAHIRVTGNERADQLAKEATEKEKDKNLIIPIKDMKPKYKEEMRKRTTEYLQ